MRAKVVKRGSKKREPIWAPKKDVTFKDVKAFVRAAHRMGPTFRRRLELRVAADETSVFVKGQEKPALYFNDSATELLREVLKAIGVNKVAFVT